MPDGAVDALGRENHIFYYLSTCPYAPAAEGRNTMQSRHRNRTTRALALLPIVLFAACSASRPTSSYWDLSSQLHSGAWVDLTHSFDSDTPHWKGFEPMGRKTLFTHDKDGFFVEQFCHVGQWGTHVDPPFHFHKDLRAVDEIPVEQMILPLVVLDVHQEVEKNPDYTLKMADIAAWEKKHGPIPEGAFVAMRTDWSNRWPDSAKMQNVDAAGVAHYPGWSAETLQYLYEVRKITASGHETTDTDPGIATTKDDYSLESYILKQNRYQIELLANLSKVPEAGALAFVSWPKPMKGSGFPARVIAVVPRP